MENVTFFEELEQRLEIGAGNLKHAPLGSLELPRGPFGVPCVSWTTLVAYNACPEKPQVKYKRPWPLIMHVQLPASSVLGAARAFLYS